MHSFLLYLLFQKKMHFTKKSIICIFLKSNPSNLKEYTHSLCVSTTHYCSCAPRSELMMRNPNVRLWNLSKWHRTRWFECWTECLSRNTKPTNQYSINTNCYLWTSWLEKLSWWRLGKLSTFHLTHSSLKKTILTEQQLKEASDLLQSKIGRIMQS